MSSIITFTYWSAISESDNSSPVGWGVSSDKSNKIHDTHLPVHNQIRKQILEISREMKDCVFTQCSGITPRLKSCLHQVKRDQKEQKKSSTTWKQSNLRQYPVRPCVPWNTWLKFTVTYDTEGFLCGVDLSIELNWPHIHMGTPIYNP